ncbi:MAG TPA: DUF1801 domain-containing protein [Anaerolineales bacterium]
MRAKIDRPADVGGYLRTLPVERSAVLAKLRRIVLDHLGEGYVARFDGLMFNYEIPLARYPRTYYRRPLLMAALAAQKSFVTLYLMAVNGDRAMEKWFTRAYAATGKKLNTGKSCVHFKAITDIPEDVVGKAISAVSVDKYIEVYEQARH